MIQHHLKTYARRFRWEWLAFVLISIVSSLLMLHQADSVPDVPLAVLESAAFLWFAVRVMRGEISFATHGGWRVRPVERGTLRTVRWIFSLSALAPVMLVRVWCVIAAVDLSAAGLFRMTWSVWILWLACAVLAAASAGPGKIRAPDTPGNERLLLAFSILGAGCVLMAAPILLNLRFKWPVSSSSSGHQMTHPGIAPNLPPDERIIQLNGWQGGSPWEARQLTPLKPLLRVPFQTGSSASIPGLNVLLRNAQPKGKRAAFTLEIKATPDRAAELGEEPVFALRYANGVWGPQGAYSRRWKPIMVPGFSVVRIEESGDFYSPMCEPWNKLDWTGLLNGAELVILAADPSGKLPPAPPEIRLATGSAEEETLPLPALPEHPTPAQLQEAAQAAVDQMHLRGSPWLEEGRPEFKLLDKAGPAIVPHVLASGPFGSGAWMQLEVFLTKHAAAEHLPAMLHMLETDGRIGSVLVQRGWKDQALPMLRRHLQDGLPLTIPALVALAELKDPALAPMLRKRFILAHRNNSHETHGLHQALREHPSIDWPALLRETWYATGGGQMLVEQCASTGDRIIFQEMAGYWLRSTRFPGKPTIHEWIAKESWDGAPEEFPAWLRGNFDKLQWDATAARWVLR